MTSRTDQAIKLIEELIERNKALEEKLIEMSKDIEKTRALVDELDNRL